MEVKGSYRDIHPKFKLNGVSYGTEELSEVAYSLIKEGEAYEKPIGNFLLDWLNQTSMVAVKTSGSTGTPKVIHLQKQQMVHSALATGTYFALQAGDKALLCLPAEYIAGKMMLVRAMVLGLELDYVNSSSFPLAQIEKEYDFSAMVPLQVGNSLDQMEQLKTLIIGGASISGALRERLRAKKTRIYETYGMTETITHIAVREISTGSGSAKRHFTALPDVQLSQDPRGCLIIHAPMVTTGAVVTNDRVRLISETEFEWLGRHDNVINSAGIKLFPEQIESKLAPFITNAFFVSSLPDEVLGQKLILVIEGTIDTLKLGNTLRSESDLERFEFPKELYTLPRFIETDTGKIRRKETLQLLNIQ